MGGDQQIHGVEGDAVLHQLRAQVAIAFRSVLLERLDRDCLEQLDDQLLTLGAQAPPS
ncbi:hypothetical protein RS9917_06695 [Synechococcus sp. RS9917]|nr:hypothetical protein RS9917_06695 [Synechococcus sp. RS9917]